MSESPHHPDHGAQPWSTRLLVAGVLVGFAGLPLFESRWAPWLVILSLGSAATLVYGWWSQRWGPRAVLDGLLARWLELHGAHLTSSHPSPDHEVRVFDGIQPLSIRLGRHREGLTARVSARLTDTTLAFRLWPHGQPAPRFTGSASRELCEDLSRAYGVEARFANLYRADANEPDQLAAVMTPALMAPLLAVAKQAGPDYRGVTFDGQHLAVHWGGPLVADPTRVMQLSRPIWRALVIDDGGPQGLSAPP